MQLAPSYHAAIRCSPSKRSEKRKPHDKEYDESEAQSKDESNLHWELLRVVLA
jgi:hypothetical protein